MVFMDFAASAIVLVEAAAQQDPSVVEGILYFVQSMIPTGARSDERLTVRLMTQHVSQEG